MGALPPGETPAGHRVLGPLCCGSSWAARCGVAAQSHPHPWNHPPCDLWSLCEQVVEGHGRSQGGERASQRGPEGAGQPVSHTEQQGGACPGVKSKGQPGWGRGPLLWALPGRGCGRARHTHPCGTRTLSSPVCRCVSAWACVCLCVQCWTPGAGHLSSQVPGLADCPCRDSQFTRTSTAIVGGPAPQGVAAGPVVPLSVAVMPVLLHGGAWSDSARSSEWPVFLGGAPAARWSPELQGRP